MNFTDEKPQWPSVDREELNCAVQVIYDSLITGYRPATTQDLAGTASTGSASASAKQFTNQSNFAPSGANGTVFTLAAGEVGFIRNLNGTDALFVKRGAGCSSASFSDILAAGAVVNDGRGNFVIFDDWIGPVSVSGSAPQFVSYKLS